MLIISFLVTLASGILGVYISFFIDSAPAPTIILILTFFFIIAFINSTKKPSKEKIKIPYPPIPHRVAGRMTCLPHKDEGLITDDKGQDRWAKGETTARNERRYVLEMQQGTWDYKSDGINQLKYELLDIEEINPKAKLINVKL